jgi:hypothetical protein
LPPTSIRFSCDSAPLTLQKLANNHPALRGEFFSPVFRRVPPDFNCA